MPSFLFDFSFSILTVFVSVFAVFFYFAVKRFIEKFAELSAADVYEARKRK